MYLILFADDMVLFTTDPESLQAQLSNLCNYSTKWGLNINVNKTKLCIFEKRKSAEHMDFYINAEKVERVDCFTYLGLKLYYTGNLLYAVNALYEQALKAYHNLLVLFDRIDFDIKTKFYLFDTMVLPILLYGSEIYGAYDFKEIDKLHIRFCKYVLGVKHQTPNYAVYGELGRYPLSVLCKERAIKYWLKLNKNFNSPTFYFYTEQLNSSNNSNWAHTMKNFIDKLGFSYLCENFDIEMNYFPSLKQRIRDQFVQKWSETIRDMPKLNYYNRFKVTFGFEEYLSILKSECLRKNLSRFRLCSHNLEIETGRYNNTTRDNRLCRVCNQNAIESEYHFLLCCPKYADLRSKYLKNCSWPTLHRFDSIMSSKSKNKIINISKFLKDAMSLRVHTLQPETVS
jgi:tetratricopeptide (TPR) repeat protein